MKTKSSIVFYLLIMGLVFLNSCQKESMAVLTTTEVTEIEQTTAVSGGNISDDGGLAVTARGVCWSTNQSPSINDSKTTNGSGTGAFSANITGLTLKTIYYVCSYATNSVGTSYGSVLSFKTKDECEDADGNVYRFVTIGNQVWMAENLKYLPKVAGPATGSNTAPYYYVYDYDGTDVNAAKATANYKTYGVLYNWPAAMAGSSSSKANPSGVKGVCPSGWHLSSHAEWTQLNDYLKGQAIAGDKLKETATAHWKDPNGATNESGFTALPGGDRNPDGTFNYIGEDGYWWTTSEGSADKAWYSKMHYDYTNVYRDAFNNEFGFSVRCVKN